MDDGAGLGPEVESHYAGGYEQVRLTEREAPLELVRTQHILQHRLAPPPGRILDIGGGPGVYAAWLARNGYEVDLLDALSLHVQQARETSSRQPDHPFQAAVGDARSLPYEEASADAVLLLGPLYHLTEREDRVQALREAGRVLKPKGSVFAAVISRFASLWDGLRRGFLDDPLFWEIVEGDLRTGQHRNPENNPAYFTTAFFHRHQDLADEVRDAGLILDRIVSIEGPGWLLPNPEDWWRDDRRRETLLRLIEMTEEEPALFGATSHLMAIAHP